MPFVHDADLRDYLFEAGRILRGDTIMLAERRHLVAVAILLGDAYRMLEHPERIDWASPDVGKWLTDARKVLA